MKQILGALVADAASLGLHWIYDFDHLQKVAGHEPAFREPELKNYEGVFSFFAHGPKKSGDFSHYGETLMVFLKSQMQENPGAAPNLRSYQSLYRDTFGPGGAFVGYIDNPTRLTLANLTTFENEAVDEAKSLSKALPDDIAKVVVQKVLPYNRKYSGEDLVVPVTRAIQVTYSQPEVLQIALAIAAAVDHKKRLDSGADDQQCPAWSTVSAFESASPTNVEAIAKNVERTVRVTNNNDLAVAFTQFAANMLSQLALKSSLEKAYEFASSKAPSEVRDFAERGWKMQKRDLGEVSAELGRTCYLRESLPLALYILKNTGSYVEAVRTNILAGGDSCGRAMFLGAAAASLYGDDEKRALPATWLLKLNRGKEISEFGAHFNRL